jgi:outer membrane autotransporter protein
LQVAGSNTDSLRTLFGARMNFVAPIGREACFVPELRAMWIHELLETNSLVSAQFAPIGGSSFVARGIDLGRDWVQLGFGIGWDIDRAWQFRTDYDAQANEHQVFHVASGNASYRW